MNCKPTQRGFLIGAFVDKWGEKCSIQESSLATERCIWLGIDHPKCQVLEAGKGWIDVELPVGTLHSGRMHLTQKMVADLLPLLRYFVRTGNLPHTRKIKKRKAKA